MRVNEMMQLWVTENEELTGELDYLTSDWWVIGNRVQLGEETREIGQGKETDE